MSACIAPGVRVSLRCRVSDEEGKLIDDGSRPLVFVCGQDQVIAGLERAVVGHAPGFRTEVILAPEDAYGPHRPELVFGVLRANLPPDLELVPGMRLHPGGSEGRFPLTVVSLTENGVLLDGNHLRAGKSLRFQIEVLATEGDIGSAGGQGVFSIGRRDALPAQW